MFAYQDTIAAIATGAGESAVSLIRVSGPASQAVLRQVFPSLADSVSPLEPRHAYLAHACSGRTGEVVDQCVVTFYRSPRSYTGEDMLEIGCHGGWVSPARVLGELLSAGCRTAEPGEFSKRAYLNGKLSLSQAEAVASLVSAKSELAQQNALRQLGDRLGETIRLLSEKLKQVAAHLDATLDFEEDEVPALGYAQLAAVLDECHAAGTALARSWDFGKHLQQGVRLVLTGKPNTGKSSLMNLLLDEDRAIVTETPGTTRDVLEGGLDLGGLPVTVADTAGLTRSDDPVERIGVSRALETVTKADLAIFVIDGSRVLDDDDRWCAEVLRQAPCSVVVAINKRDLRQDVTESEVRELTDGVPQVATCGLTGEGVGNLLAAAQEVLQASRPAGPEDLIIVSARHREALVQSADASLRARTALQGGMPLDIIATEVKATLGALGKITGETTTEALLDEVFAQFCIGK